MYFLNLEAVIHALQLRKYGTLLFSHPFVAGGFSLVLVLGTVLLYRTVWQAPGWGWRGRSLVANASESPEL